MKKPLIQFLGIASIGVMSLVLWQAKKELPSGPEGKQKKDASKEYQKGRLSGADKQLASWFWNKGYPDPSNLSQKYLAAWEQGLEIKENTRKLLAHNNARVTGYGNWSNIGPKAHGGRMLSLAINPVRNSTIFSGSAGGGIWKTYDGGTTATSWEPVRTNFPTLGVSAIVYQPADTNVMLAGTGEVYRVETLLNGASSTNQTGNIGHNVWKCRGTYGIGILKSNDGGKFWFRTKMNIPSDLFGVKKIRFDPNNSAKVYAAASDGLYRSLDSGNNWTKIYNATYVSDVMVSPSDATGNTMVIAVGNMNNTTKGIFRSTNGGTSFALASGLPSTFNGYINFDYGTTSGTLIAGITGTGGNEIYVSSNFGSSWTAKTSSAFAGGQYWFANDLEINPADNNIVLAAGVNILRYSLSGNAGTTIGNGSATMNTFITAGSQEGSTTYVHDDVHDIEYVPGSGTIIYMATDGGIFRSTNSGSNWASCNGGLTVHQFYGPIAQSQLNINYWIGGLQDNNVIRSNSTNTGWSRVVGGDGGPCMFMPGNENVVIASRDARAVYYSSDNGASYTQKLSNLGIDYNADERTGFMAPIAVSPATPNRMYVASDNIHLSTDGGVTFNKNTPSLMTAPIEALYKTATALAVSNTNAMKLYVAVSPISQTTTDAIRYLPPSNVFRSTDGGTTFTKITNTLPDRFVNDFAISRSNDDSVFVAIGGFGTTHIYVTGDGGTTWTPRGSGLPDVPFNAVMLDVNNPQILYAGCDQGIYVSPDRGQNWYDFNTGLWDATHVIDLVAAPDGIIKAVTHGKGFFQAPAFNPIILPVNILSFTGKAQGAANELKWTASDEKNLSHYELERSLDGGLFQKVGRVTARNSSSASYSFTDGVLNMSYYYRLKSVNSDGSYVYSDIIILRRESKNSMQVIGNPVTSRIDLRFSLTQGGKAVISLYDMTGKLVRREMPAITTGQSSYSVQNLNSISSGVYYVEAVINRERWTQKVVKN
jgi:photosystem II stability/assembly factor-like uncharacterized protein